MADLSGSVAGIVEGAAKCEQCGATSHLANGCCVSCLLKENFEAEIEASAEVFEDVLAEEGITDLSSYAYVEGAELQVDLFVDHA